MKKQNAQCKIGKRKPLTAKDKKAIAHWQSLQGARSFTFVGSLPAPPEGVMAMYCMSFWMIAYRTAAQTDANIALLPAQVQAYTVCVAQHTV